MGGDVFHATSAITLRFHSLLGSNSNKEGLFINIFEGSIHTHCEILTVSLEQV